MRSSRNTPARAEVYRPSSRSPRPSRSPSEVYREDLGSGRRSLATVTVTVKLTPEDVAWLDAEIERRKASGREQWTPTKYSSTPTRSSIVRELVEAQRASLFPPVKPKR